MSDKEILQQYLMGNKTVIFYVEFKKLYASFCDSLYYDYQKNYGYSEKECEKQRYEDCMTTLRKIIYLVWSSLDNINKFPKEELYMVLNCVRIARSEKIKDAIDLSSNEKFKELEESYTNSR